MLLLSSNNGKVRFPGAQAHQTATIDEWKNFSSMSLDWCRIRHENMDPRSPVSTVQAAAGGLRADRHLVGALGKFSSYIKTPDFTKHPVSKQEI